MRMYLRSRDIAVTGIIMAVGVVLIILGGYINTATLFFLAAAAFLAGVMERNHSPVLGFIYLVGAAVLGLMLSPQKLQVATFCAMGCYVLVAEWFEKRMYIQKKTVSLPVVWGSKFLTFHALLAAALALFELLVGIENIAGNESVIGKILGNSGAKDNLAAVLSWVVIIVFAEVFWIVFDRAYIFFQRTYGHYFSDRYMDR